MNIVLVIEGTYPWYRGGVSEWVYQYLQNSSGTNFSILQIATDTFIHLDPDEALYPIPDNVEQFIRIKPPELTDEWEGSFEKWYDQNENSISKSLINGDVIHVTNTGFAGWLGFKMNQVSDKPFVLTEHALYWLEVQKGAVALECGYKIPKEKEGFVVDIFKEIARRVYKHADKVISVSRCNMDLQKDFDAYKPIYIPNGIPSAEIMQDKPQRSKAVIGWVGRCAEMKNPRLFFDYVQASRENGYEFEFLMLLSDAGEKTLEKQVRELHESYPEVKVIWNENAISYFKEMDFLLLTSHNESQPLVIFEALAKNVLPTGKKVGDFNIDFGLAFDNESIEEQLSQINDIWNEKPSYKSILSSKRALLEQKHTWENIFKEYRTTLLSILDENSSVVI